MQQNIQPQAHLQLKVNSRNSRYIQAQVRADADAALRDIAFVLKMTQKVRQEIEQKQEVAEAILA